MQSWDEYYIKLAMLIASKSKDPSTQVGCVIVGPDNEIRSTGFNGFPRGVKEVVPGTKHFPTGVWKDLAIGENVTKCGGCGDHIVMTKDMGTELILSPHFEKATGVVLHPDRWERPAKYEWVEHAEKNAVYNAARIGVALKGCRAYLNWEPRPCIECCKAFIQAGIVEVIGPNTPFPSGGTRKDWKFDVSTIMMDEAGVKYREVEWSVE